MLCYIMLCYVCYVMLLIYLPKTFQIHIIFLRVSSPIVIYWQEKGVPQYELSIHFGKIPAP